MEAREARRVEHPDAVAGRASRLLGARERLVAAVRPSESRRARSSSRSAAGQSASGARRHGRDAARARCRRSPSRSCVAVAVSRVQPDRGGGAAGRDDERDEQREHGDRGFVGSGRRSGMRPAAAGRTRGSTPGPPRPPRRSAGRRHASASTARADSSISVAAAARAEAGADRESARRRRRSRRRGGAGRERPAAARRSRSRAPRSRRARSSARRRASR